MFPHQKPLPKPSIITTPEFEVLLTEVKTKVLSYLAEHAPMELDAVQTSLSNEAELMTKVLEALTFILQNHIRQINADAMQMFGMYATDTAMVDLIVSQLGVQRLVLSEGDPNAFPPEPAVMESNDALLTRYYLAAYALASTGTRSGYRFHAMTLGGRPEVKVDSTGLHQVQVQYTFAPHQATGQTKDAQARQVAPGQVDCYILSHEGNGVPTPELLAATQAYLTRDDIAQETDFVTVKAPDIRPWTCEASLYVAKEADAERAKTAAEAAITSYASKQHSLGGRIEPSMIYSIMLQSTGAYRADLTHPEQPLRCIYREAPYLESINITVITDPS